jgi:hypothetical protein
METVIHRGTFIFMWNYCFIFTNLVPEKNLRTRLRTRLRTSWNSRNFPKSVGRCSQFVNFQEIFYAQFAYIWGRIGIGKTKPWQNVWARTS